MKKNKPIEIINILARLTILINTSKHNTRKILKTIGLKLVLDISNLPALMSQTDIL